jgi:hypothetical protein
LLCAVAGGTQIGVASSPERQVDPAGTGALPTDERSAVYVEPVTLSEVYDQAIVSLNIGAVLSDEFFADGFQKAADIWGLNVDLFRLRDLAERRRVAESLIANTESLVVVDALPREDWTSLKARAAEQNVLFQVHSGGAGDEADRAQRGFEALKAARASLLSSIPKYDQVLPVAYPVSPLPDSFFKPSGAPQLRPLVRVERSIEARSAGGHGFTASNMMAPTGTLLRRSSHADPEVFIMGMEGANLAVRAMPGALDPRKASAIMTAWVLAIRGQGDSGRDIMVENDGLEPSFFKPAIHAPEELEAALDAWKEKCLIEGYRRLSAEEVQLNAWHGADRVLRAGLFLAASDRGLRRPDLVAGHDLTGRRAIDFCSSQGYCQQLVEVPATGWLPPAQPIMPTGGILTARGASAGNAVGSPLGALLTKIEQPSPNVQPYLLSVEGGFFVVTPESLSESQLHARVSRVDFGLRGPLTSDQAIVVSLAGGDRVTLRRTILNFSELDSALDFFRSFGFVQDWRYEGGRGRGVDADVVLHPFLGKDRRFMSSLAAWPNEDHPRRPLIRLNVDGVQRLGFTLLATSGWRQEFVEVPLRVPPAPRDVELQPGVHHLN